MTDKAIPVLEGVEAPKRIHEGGSTALLLGIAGDANRDGQRPHSQ
jgi:hypothetical protein